MSENMIHPIKSEEILPCVIVGGGLVGGLAALLLTQGGVNVTVLDAAPVLDQEKVLSVQNPRALALTQATIALLKAANVWQSLEESERIIPFTGMKAWNNHGYGEVLLGKELKNPLPHEWLGVMVEPSVLNLYIQKQLLSEVGNYRTGCKVKNLKKIENAQRTVWQIQLDNDETIFTHLVIGADGAQSFVREQAGIKLDVLDYKQSVLSCVLLTEEHHQHTPRQMYNPTPFALLPMASKNKQENGYLHSLAWTLPTHLAEEYVKLDHQDFEQLLNRESHYMLGKIQLKTLPTMFSIKARSAKSYSDEGLVLIGDAAHTIHPLAGQGMNLGFLDVGVLCDILLHEFERGGWANVSSLRRYERQRKGHNVIMMHSMSMMGWLEGFQNTPLRWALNWGRKQVNNTALIKQFLMYQANGVHYLSKTRYIKYVSK